MKATLIPIYPWNLDQEEMVLPRVASVGVTPTELDFSDLFKDPVDITLNLLDPLSPETLEWLEKGGEYVWDPKEYTLRIPSQQYKVRIEHS